MTISNCTECKHHKIIQDPDHTDWFNYDDVAVICQIKVNDNIKPNSKYAYERSQYKPVTWLCRPTNIIPSWCPISKQNLLNKNIQGFLTEEEKKLQGELLQSEVQLLMADFIIAYMKEEVDKLSSIRKSIQNKKNEANKLNIKLLTTVSFPFKNEQLHMEL